MTQNDKKEKKNSDRLIDHLDDSDDDFHEYVLKQLEKEKKKNSK